MIATPSPTAVVISASAMPADTVPMPPPPLVGSASFWKAVMMPPTVPNSPTNGADDATVASSGKPRRRPASCRSLLRSIARLTTSATSNGAAAAPGRSTPRAYSVRPAPMTLATGLPAKRLSSPTASRSRPVPSTIGASAAMYRRDCLRPRQNVRSRSPVMASEYSDIATSTSTTARATMPISFHSPTSVKSICVSLSPCFGLLLPWLELKGRGITERDGNVVREQGAELPGLHLGDDRVVEQRVRALHQRDPVDGAGGRHADLHEDAIEVVAAIQRRRKVGGRPVDQLLLGHGRRQG